MRKNIVLISAVFIFVIFLTIKQTLPPAPLPASAPPAEFSAERAAKYIYAIAKKPHLTGSPEIQEVRSYILNELRGLGIQAEIDKDGDLQNVIGRIEGTHSSGIILLTAHFDSTKESPGAMDDTSGVAALLETARALKANEPLKNTIVFLFTDHEEGGHYGAKAFIANHPWAKDVKVVIGLDAGGISGPSVLSTTSPKNGWLIRQLVAADRFLVGSSAVNAFGDSSTDFGRAFKSAGFSGYAFDLYWDKRIDGSEDNIQNINISSVQHQGYHLLSLTRRLGNLSDLVDPKEPDEVFFSVLRLFIVHYPSTYALPFAIVVIALLCGVFIYGLRHKILSWSGVGYGTAIFFFGLIAAALPGLFIEYVIGHFIPGVTKDYDNRLLDGPFTMSGITFLAIALVLFSHVWAHKLKKVEAANLVMGALVPIVIGMVVTSIILPALSFAFTWPLAFSLFACVKWFYFRTKNREPHGVIWAFVFSGIVAIVVIGPSIVLGLFSELILTLVFLGTLCGFLLPQIYLMIGKMDENRSISPKNQYF